MSSSPNEVYDPVRKKWVKATPEERIRQGWVTHLVEKLGYPLALLAIEVELKRLPHLALVPTDQIPKRRADIIALSKEGKPLLMIECKAVPLTPQFAQQVLGYNSVVRAPYVAIANDKEVLTASFDAEGGHVEFKPGLPTFSCC